MGQYASTIIPLSGPLFSLAPPPPLPTGEPPRWEDLVEQHRIYFERHPKLTFDSVLVYDYDYSTVLFVEHNNKGGILRRIRVKYASNDVSTERITRQALFLARLQGAEHIEQIIPLHQGTINIGEREYPMIALEHFPNASLDQLREKLRAAERGVPNKVAWSIMLCSLARPPRDFGRLGLDSSNAVHREDEVEEETALFMHNFPDCKNFYFGDIQPGDDEHGLIPVVKMTNFSRASWGGDEEEEDESTGFIMHDLGSVLFEFMAYDEPIEELRRNLKSHEGLISNVQLQELYGHNARARNLIPSGHIVTTAPRWFTQDPEIDPALNQIIARCMNLSGAHHLNRRMLRDCAKDGYQNRTLDDVPAFQHYNPMTEGWRYDEEGGDDFIRKFVQEYILNADTDPRPEPESQGQAQESLPQTRKTVKLHILDWLHGSLMQSDEDAENLRKHEEERERIIREMEELRNYRN
ncbi:hypothetical protein M426DRAFT_260777 [Hypoxylon sp. CI-4A]|nr:hypothetical protein M426DRAFT_260777 [Hypoxylon sp. CI-4A]